MSTAYWFTMPPPPDPERDAILREAALLRSESPGPAHFLSPGRSLHGLLPTACSVLLARRAVRRRSRDIGLHHVFADDLRWCGPFVDAASPYILSLTTALPSGRPPAPPASPPAAVTVRLEADRRLLEAAGWQRVRTVPAGARISHLSPTPPPDGPPWRLLFASAPWTGRQFRTKGLDALFAAVERRSDLSLVLLWRGVLEEEIRRRISRAGLADRVELVLERTDVGAQLQRCHAAVLFATGPRQVTPHPHSLLEALAAGRPVALSRQVALASVVERRECGVAADGAGDGEVLEALSRLLDGYEGYRRRAAAADWTPWSAEAYLEAFRSLRAELDALAAGRSKALDTAPRNDSRP